MGGQPSQVSRVRSGATHRSTLVTSWKVRVTGIEFIKDFQLRESVSNLSNKPPESICYPKIRENFKGWGRGEYVTGWDWEGADNPKRVACYRRQMPITMRVRLHSSHPAPSARTFTLQVDPLLDGAKTPLTSGMVSVNWSADSQEQIVEIATCGELPNEVSKYDLRLTWSLRKVVVSSPEGKSTAGVGGVIHRTRHTIYGIYEEPLRPESKAAAGEKWYADTCLTRQRLEKLIVAIAGAKHRFPTPDAAAIDHLIWQLHVHINDSSPPYFNGARAVNIRYGFDGPQLEVGDQWLLWLASRTWNRKPKEQPHWNYGACITYVQLMKTMLAMAGINAHLAWVYPKTPLLPDGTRVDLADSDLVSVAMTGRASVELQRHTFTVNGVEYNALVRLIDRPHANGDMSAEAFEACLYYGGKLVPGAIPTRRYPEQVLKDQTGFAGAKDLLQWWHGVKHGGFDRFMAWVSQSPEGYFDKNGRFYSSPYAIPVDKRLPLP